MLKEVGLFSLDKQGHGAEDWDLWLKLARNKARIHYIEEVLGTYALYGDNMSEAHDFHRKCLYVFESHVSSIDPITLEIEKKIKGSRAFHKLVAAGRLISLGRYNNAINSMLEALMIGLTSSFFWSQVLFKSTSKLRRTFIRTRV